LQKKYYPFDKKSSFNEENIEKLTMQLDEIKKEINKPGMQRNFDLEQNSKDLGLLLDLLKDTRKINLINQLEIDTREPLGIIYEYNEYIQNILKIINDIASKNVARIKIDNINTNINSLSKDMKKIFLLQKVLRDYIIPKNINIYIENEDPDIIQLLKTDYSQYMRFIDQIKKLLNPVNESSNTQLQMAIKNFAENTEDSKEYSFKKILDDLFLQRIPSKYEILYTGLNNININKDDDAKYEIYISFDLLEGEYNDETIKSINCNYSGLYFGKKFQNWLESNNSGISYKEEKVFLLKEELTKNTNKKLQKNVTIKGGKTYRLKKYKNKTRKRN